MLVIGVSGLIGRAAALSFSAAGHPVTGISRGHTEFPDRSALERALPGVELIQGDVGRPEVAESICPEADLIVFAGGVSGVAGSFRDPVGSLAGSAVPWLQSLLFCRAGTRLLFVSSQLVYGPTERRAFSESNPYRAQSPYALHRFLMEEHGRLYAERRDLDVVVLRLGNVYGPVANVDAPRSHGFVAQMLKDLVRDGELRLFGGGDQRVDLLHVDDLAMGLRAITPSAPGFRIFNMSGEQLAVREVAEALLAGVGRGKLVDVPWPPSAQRTLACDVALDDRLFRRTFRWAPERKAIVELTHIAASWR